MKINAYYKVFQKKCLRNILIIFFWPYILYLDPVQPPPAPPRPKARNSTKPSFESGPFRTRRKDHGQGPEGTKPK